MAYRVTVVGGLLLFLAVVLALPSYYETMTLWYKTGIDKILLRTGKITGIAALMLMFFQLIFINRFRLLEKYFKLKDLIRIHKTNGLLLMSLALVHPILVLAADHFVFFPFEKKYWPEFTGVLLLFILLFFVLLSALQKKMNFPYRSWKKFHSILAPALFSLVFIHLFNVSETFKSGLPLYAMAGLLIITICLFLRILLK